MSSDIKKSIQLPMLAIRGLVVFEGMTLHFDVGRKKSILALKQAMETDRRIFLTAQKDSMIDDPEMSDLYQMGMVATVKQMLKGQDGVVHVVVTGDFRAKIASVHQKSPHVEVMVLSMPLSKSRMVQGDKMEALMRVAKTLFEKYSALIPKMSREIILEARAQTEPTGLFQAIAFNIMIKVEDRQALLETNRIDQRLKLLVEILERECEVLSLEQDIYEQVKNQMDKNQRDYYLREQLRVIENQLGEGEDTREDATDFVEQIALISNISDEDREKLYKEADRLYKCPPQSQEAMVIRSYLEHCLELPWDVYTKDYLDFARARRILNSEHHGMEKVKERILEILAVRKLVPDMTGPIICLAGPPGVGKTSIAKSIAQTLGRAYVRISLGGMRDESDIRGHRKTYIGAMPGRIMAALKQAQVRNPVILLDEIDKMGADFKGDPSAAMLEVLDPEQNNSFRDHYLEIPFDLSEALFITTANDLHAIPTPLLDRMEVIRLSSYTREEKFQIAKKHLIKKQKEKHGLRTSDIGFTHDGLYTLIDRYTREAGVRKLEQAIATVCRKTAKQKVSLEEEYRKVTINQKSLERLLGPKRYSVTEIPDHDQVGVVTGLAWTSVGGETMEIEADIYDGAGKLQITGNLGGVMTESANIAVSYVRGIAAQYGIDADFYKKKDIHIHAPEGAVPKDGPSAGVTMTTALVSALSGIAVRRDIAMTGEISLRGRVMQIGGLKEKAIAAYRAGVTTVLIPYDNQSDIEEFDDIIKNNVRFIAVLTIRQVLQHALVEQPIRQPSKPCKEGMVLVPAEQNKTVSISPII